MDAKRTTLVLLGRTGNGKSSTGNSILGRDAFTSFWSMFSVTKECQLESRTWSDGRIINVIDTPGLFDTNSRKEDIDRKIVQCIELAKDGVHGFLLVVSVTNRFTDEEADVIDSLEILFGPTIMNYMVVVFTGGDKLEKRRTTLEKHLEQCPPSIKRVINRCNSRMLVFNNKKPSENQITKLMAQVDRIVADNGNQPYSNNLFNKAQMMTSQLYHIKDKEKMYSEQIKRLNEMMQENMRAMEEKTRAMEENTRAMEERMRGVTKELEKQLEAARSARMSAENEAVSVKQALDARIRDLENKLKERTKDLEDQFGNTRAMEERMQEVRKELEKQLEAARSARVSAENEAVLVKQALEARIRDLEKEKKEKELEEILKTKNGGPRGSRGPCPRRGPPCPVL